MIRRYRRHAAPVIDAGRDQFTEPRSQVRRRLDVHFRAENDARHGDGPLQFVVRGFHRQRHLRVRLGAKILDDDFLDVTVLPVQVAKRQQRLHALFPCFSDANQYPRRERHRQFSGKTYRLQAHRGMLVR